MTKEKKKRAPGAGVKRRDGTCPLDRAQVLLDPATTALMSLIGAGNVSLGIREAGRRLAESNDTEPFSEARHEMRAAASAKNT